MGRAGLRPESLHAWRTGQGAYLYSLISHLRTKYEIKQIAMGRPKRDFLVTAAETESPPASLKDSHVIARVRKAEGNNLYSINTPDGKETLLVELPAKFRSQIWIRRGGFVVVNTAAFDDRSNKLGGEIVNIIRDEKQWRKQAYWSLTVPVLARYSTY